MFLLLSIISSLAISWSGETTFINELDTPTIISLIHIESTGDECAKRPGSRFYGLLQISNEYAQDAFEYAGREVVEANTLMCEGRDSLKVFYWYMNRYEFLHGWNPEYVAMIHKMGPTGFQRAKDNMEDGVSFKQAIIEEGTPGAKEYLVRFRKYKRLYEQIFTES